ncbi:MAG TPA: 30S ribosomal protein S6 [bacterium]|nr:30S ribosomal protein S6 [bacterium]
MSNFLKYDVIYILDPNATTEDAAAVSAKVEQITADAKGTVLKKDDWGKRRLAYLVQKHREGHYIFYHLSLPPDAVAEVQRNLRLMEKVIKFSIVQDTISHLKAKVKPVRVKTSTGTEGSSSRPGYSRPTNPSTIRSASSHVTSSPAPAAAPAPAPAPAPSAEAQNSPS